jgi:hypothetical protein
MPGFDYSLLNEFLEFTFLGLLLRSFLASLLGRFAGLLLLQKLLSRLLLLQLLDRLLLLSLLLTLDSHRQREFTISLELANLILIKSTHLGNEILAESFTELLAADLVVGLGLEFDELRGVFLDDDLWSVDFFFNVGAKS